MPLKIDLHVHTNYSHDSLITLEDIILHARKRGLDGVAITDHDRLDGALQIAKTLDIPAIPGVEVSSSKGHIIGLNVQEQIPSKLDVDETVDRIHEAGGIAIACHPTTLFKGNIGKYANSKFDAIEVINSSAFPFKYSVKRSEKLASRLGISRVAGSDAHYGPEIGLAYTIIDAELEVEEIIKAIKGGFCRPFGGATPLKLRLRRKFLSYKGKILSKKKRDFSGNFPSDRGLTLCSAAFQAQRRVQG
ncbi:MAG: CehA/McbA family metallohydrolase [Candidatus Bathyarchaeia archaeon]